MVNALALHRLDVEQVLVNLTGALLRKYGVRGPAVPGIAMVKRFCVEMTTCFNLLLIVCQIKLIDSSAVNYPLQSTAQFHHSGPAPFSASIVLRFPVLVLNWYNRNTSN